MIAESDTVFWPTGNPSAEYNGDDRPGDNLYSDCILALDAKTGKLKWHYQTTPHDLWDWDATETPVVVDAPWQGQPRKLLIQANRNGFFYVFDRTDGKLLLAKPFVTNLNWASGIGPDGRPVKLPNMQPSAEGTKVCPSQDGATNWFSPVLQSRHGPVLCADLREMQCLHQARSGAMDGGQGIPRRIPASARRREAAENSESHRYQDRQDRVESPAARAGRILGRHAQHVNRAGDLRRGRRSA